jgi:hypothetical protein
LNILVGAAILAAAVPTVLLLAAPAGRKAEVYVENRKAARMVVLTLALFFLPLINGLVGGLVGG